MKYLFTLILPTIILLFPVSMRAQILLTEDGGTDVSEDVRSFSNSLVSDSLVTDSSQEEKEAVKIPGKTETFKPNPTKAVIYSAIFPGLGQLYNRKYWKLPIVYGGFLGCIYAITWNGNQYSGYKSAYNDFIDKNPATKSWEAYVFYSWKRDNEHWQDQETWSSSQTSSFSNVLKNKKDFYRRNRDLSYIITVGVYAICMIDAYVDAQLFDFDITPDLSLRMEPVIMPASLFQSKTVGLQCSLTF